MMSVEEAKKELREYRDNIKYIDEKQDDLEELRTRLEKTTTRLSKSKTSNNSLSTDKFSDGIIRMQALEEEYENKLEEMLLKKFVIEDKIDKLDEPYRSILYFRYVRCKKWDEIARNIDYSIQDTYRKHGKALYYYSLL